MKNNTELKKYGTLCDYKTSESIRPATEAEWRASPELVNRDEDGTAYITEADGKTRIYAIQLDNDEGWVLERQNIGGDENPERLSEHESADAALAELFTYA